MRTRDIMTSPVVTVPPDAHLALPSPLAAESASPRPGPNVTESAGRTSLPGLVPCGQAYGRTQPLR